jgi:acyl-CoA synthetase (AMP-forming)/AMP-acid ligase II
MALIERVRGMSIATSLANRATMDPDGTFLLYQDRLITFGQVDTRSDALAASLAALGLEAGDRVALILPPCPEFVVALFAAAKLGAAVVPLNPYLSKPELQYMLRHSEAVLAVTVEEHGGEDFLALFDELLPQLPELQYVVTVGEEDLWYDDQIFQLEDLLSSGQGRDYPPVDVDPEQDSFAILYTAGTMGKPKGVELTHANLLEVAAGTAVALELSPEDRVIGVTGFFHLFGLGIGILGSILSGSTLILQGGFGAAETLALVQRHRATVHYGVPTLFSTGLIEQSEASLDLSSLRVAMAAGGPASDDLRRSVERDICPDFRVAYSVTEGGAVVCVTHRDDPPEKRHQTTGRPLPGMEIQVLDNDGTQLPPESLGEIAIRGPGVMRRYYRQPQETEKVLRDDGFLLTGDLGMLDEEGYLHLVGRRREVIIRHGFSVYPREVEDRLQAHPAVCEAAVVGVPDEVLGEAVCACIVPVEGAIVTGPEVMDWCRVILADYKVPDLVRFLDDFPRTGNGKPRRIELARMIRAELMSREN